MVVQQPEVLALSVTHASELQARELLAALPVAVYTTDPNGYITAYNSAAVKFWGTQPVLGQTRWSGSHRLFYPDGRTMPHEECPMALALRDGQGVYGAEVVAERPDGSRVPFLAFPVVLRDESGSITGAVNTLVDISEQKQTRDARHRLAAIVDSSADAIISKDLNGIIKTWNRSAERVFGYAAADVIGKPITILIPEDRLSEEEMILGRIRKGEVVDHFETQRRCRDGRIVPISVTISPVRGDDGRIVGASKIARDISDQKETENRIRMLMREVNHRVKNQFAVILSMTRGISKHETSLKRYTSQIEDRIIALARSHDLLVQGEWKGTTISNLVLEHLKPFGAEEIVSLSGPPVTLSATAVQYLGIAFHELATNSAKYGALKNAKGKLFVEWSTTDGDAGEDCLLLTWREVCGRKLTPPSRTGFGSTVLERVVPSSVGGSSRLAFEPAGIVWRLTAPRANVEASLEETGNPVP